MRLASSAPRPGYYAGLEDYILTKGHLYESQPLTASEVAFVKAVRARGRYPIKECFSNSQRVVLDFLFQTMPAGINVKYAEGYALRHDLPLAVHHAWLDLNGKVVDLTMRKKFGKGSLLGVGAFAGVDYWGVAFSMGEVRKRAAETGSYGTLLDDWERGHPYMKIGYTP